MKNEGKVIQEIENDEFYEQFLKSSSKALLTNSLGFTEQVKKLGEGIEILNRELQRQVLENHDDLLRQASHASKLENVLDTMNMHIQNLFANAERLRTQITAPCDQLETHTRVLGRLHRASHILRQVSRVQQLSKRLSNTNDPVQKATLLQELEQLAIDPELSDIDAITTELRSIRIQQQKVVKLATGSLNQGIVNENVIQTSTALQIFINLGIIKTTVDNFIKQNIDECQEIVKTAFEINLNSGLNKPKGGPGRIQLTSSQGFRSKVWSELEKSFADDIYQICKQVKFLQLTLNELHIQNIDRNLASQFWSKLGKTIQDEIKQSTSAVQQMLEEDYPKLLKNYYEMTKKLNYDQFKFDRSVLKKLENSYLSSSLTRILDPVQSMFNAENNVPSHDEIDSLIRVVTSELSMALVEEHLSEQVSKNVGKCIRMFAVKTEQQIETGPEAAQVIGGTPNAGQQKNINYVNALYYLLTQVQRMLINMKESLSESGVSKINESLQSLNVLTGAIIQPLIVSINSVIETIIVTMHLEPDWMKLQVSVNKSIPSSPYMRELVQFITRVYNTYLINIQNKEVLCEKCNEIALRCIDLFVRHSAILRPISQGGRQRLQADYYHLEEALKLICPQLPNLGRPYRLIKSMASLITQTPEEIVAGQASGSSVPHSTILLMLFSFAGQDLASPHQNTGWALEKILYLEVNINEFKPFGGSSYIKLPEFIGKKHAVINVFNQDECCFAWAITSALFPVANRSSETGSYPHYSRVLNLTGMDFPVKLRDISKFEQLNNISVNVYGLEKKFENNKLIYEIVGPLRYSGKKLFRHVNLLLITKDCNIKDDDEHICDTTCTRYHYCWIKDLSRLCSSQISSNEEKLYFCDGCLIYFSSLPTLMLHQKNDCNHKYTVTPTIDVKLDKFGKSVAENILKFENIEKQMRVPFVVYADFESILKPLQTTEPNPQNSYSIKSVKHEPFSFAYLIKCSFDDSISKFELYRGNDAAQVFVSRIESDLRSLYNTYLKDIKKMERLTDDEIKEFNNATVCSICEHPFDDISNRKVMDHCHITGKKRPGATHSICNLNYKIPNFIPIIFHNLSGYDCHMFIKELCRHGDKVDVIAQSKEKYVSFTKSIYVHDYVDKKSGTIKKKYLKLRFIDSFKFLSTSLENLGNGLDVCSFRETQKHFPNNIQFNLMRQKGIFPYSFVDSIEKMNNTTLPTKSQFYDSLSDEDISDVNYERAKTVWRIFNCQNLGDYSDLYLKSDVLLLCDVFEQFRDTCLQTYKLDPAQYYTLPGFSFDCMLRVTKVELELLTDIDTINFFKKGIRGGISQCSERKHIANNIYLPNYNPSEPSSFIIYLDATNLYGHSMSQSLPFGGFGWLSKDEITNLNIMDVDDNGVEGYVLEVDVHYPNTLHDLHSDLPFLVENIIPPTESAKLSKLIPNLNNKKNYIVHYRTLKQAISNGLIVAHTHRVLKFNQSTWLKTYIDLNTDLRNRATTKFGKDTFKLIINAVFGKTMENVDNRNDIQLVTQWENSRGRVGARALISRPHYKNCSVFNEEFVAIHMDKLKVKYDKPIFIGFSILDLSKTVIYDFFYNFIKVKYGNNASLLYTDTDSLILKVFTDDFYRVIIENPDKFDTSNYREGNIFNIKRSQSIVGRMKDEFPGDPILSFYGTGAKAYYINSIDSEVKKTKGIKKSVVEKYIHLEDYRTIVERGGIIYRKMKTFRSYKHDVYTEIINKVALSHHDDKRYIIPSTTKTLPWGHQDIQFYETRPEDNLEILLQVINSFLPDNNN